MQFHEQFDCIILLSAPAGVITQRLASQATNAYRRPLGELQRVLQDLETIEPQLRRAADHEVQTTIPFDEVVTAILRLASS